MNQKDFDRWLDRDSGGDSARETLVMGVINVTPDSFSDGGTYLDPSKALEQAREMVETGADWIDVGGESTRPGSQPVPADEQIRRVRPVIAAISAATLPVVLSIDTTDSSVAAAALDAGATIVNDISAGRFDAQMFSLVARRAAAMVLMHMQGTPATMQIEPRYADVVAEVGEFLQRRCDAAIAAGVETHRILLDPGLGFGKTIDHNLELLRSTRQLADKLARPIVVGPSRKGFIGTITREPLPHRRAFGTAAAVAWAITNGASVVRVHDVGPMYQIVQMTRAIMRGQTMSPG